MPAGPARSCDPGGRSSDVPCRSTESFGLVADRFRANRTRPLQHRQDPNSRGRFGPGRTGAVDRGFVARAAESFDTLVSWLSRATRSSTRRRPGSATIADVAERAGVSVPTVSKVINGRADVAPETRRRVEAAIREHGYQRPPAPARRAPLLEVIFHELESEWALEIVRGVERVAGQHQLAVVLSEMQGRRTPGRELDRGRARPPAGRGHRRLLGHQRLDAHPAADARHPVRRRRPDRRAAPRHPVGRRDQLERRPDGDTPPARPRAPPDRGHRRPGLDPVQPRAARRLPRGDGRGRRAGGSALAQPRRVPRRGGDRPRPGPARPRRTARRRSSRGTTSRRWACTRRHARHGSTSRRT